MLPVSNSPSSHSKLDDAGASVGHGTMTLQSIRLLVLILLCCQNAGHALITRYSQGILHEKYSSTEVVLVAEVIKMFFSGYVAVNDKSEQSDNPGVGLKKLQWLVVNSKKIILLVVFYGLANLLTYFALARVEASVYTVVLQLKILSTAAFSVMILNRNISHTKWRALFLLVASCILVASPAFNKHEATAPNGSLSAIPVSKDTEKLRRVLEAVQVSAENLDNNVVSVCFGIGAILLMVALSGYSAVYFEGVLKQSEKITIWERNFQLAFFSIIFMVVMIAWENASAVLGSSSLGIESVSDGYAPFRGWTVNTWLVVLLQAAGGLLVAATLKYADAVMKTLATAGSIVLATVLGHVLLNGVLDMFVSLGCLLTILAIFNYTLDQ